MHAENPMFSDFPFIWRQAFGVLKPMTILMLCWREVLPGDPLTAWFKINGTNPDARTTTYQNFPQSWNMIKGEEWKPRQRGYAIGRMYFAAPSSGERFYLRTLLTVKPGGPLHC